jgi:hypothetical protein
MRSLLTALRHHASDRAGRKKPVHESISRKQLRRTNPAVLCGVQ